jgi:hypothetical protein
MLSAAGAAVPLAAALAPARGLTAADAATG